MEMERAVLSPMLSAALRLLEQGLSIIPLKKRGKTPLISWAEYQKRQATEEEVENWFEKNPDANIGIVTGSISGIYVVDGDGEIGSRWIAERFPRTSIYAQTGREYGCHCYFRLPVGLIVQSKNGVVPKVDIKAEGGYVVAPPSIHENGNTYQWILSPELNGWDDLPELDPTPILKTGNLNLNLSNVQTIKDVTEPVVEGSRNSSIASLTGKLIKLGTSLEEAKATALTLNRNNKPPLPEAEVLQTVESVFRTHIKNHPGTSPAEITAGVQPEEETVPFLAQQATDTYPTAILQPGGILQDIMDYIDRSSAANLPLFGLAAAITMLGAVVGQKVMTESTARTNIYAVALGYSGAGKSGAVGATSVLQMSDAAPVIGCTEVTSSAAILKSLAMPGRHVQYCAVDELGMVLSGLKNPNSSAADLPRMLTKLFSGTNKPESKTYADSAMNFTVPWHHLSVFGAATPDSFWSSLGEGDTTNGFLARFLVFESLERAPLPRDDVDARPPEELIKKINKLMAIQALPSDRKLGNLEQANPDLIVPNPHKIKMSAEAKPVFKDFKIKYHELKNDHRHEATISSIYGRVAEHAIKLALIHAVSKHGDKIINREIDLDSVVWAMAVAEASCRKILSRIHDSIATNSWHRDEQKIIRYIKNNATEKTPGVTARLIKKHINAKGGQGDEIIKGMVDKGILFTKLAGKTCLLCLRRDYDK